MDKSEFENDPEMQEYRDDTQRGTRTEDVDQPTEFKDRLRSAYSAVEDGDVSKTVSTYDEDIAALLTALDEDADRREELHTELSQYLGRGDAEEVTRTEVLRLAIRAGLKAADEDIVDALRETKVERVAESF